MKIILKNSITKKLSIYQPEEPSNIRYGDLITCVRELQGNYNFLLSYYMPYDSTPYYISNQQDLNKLIDIEKESRFIQISIDPSESLPDKSFEQYFNSQGSQSRSNNNSNNFVESSQSIKSERSEVGKFRKVKNLNQEESDVSEVKEGDIFKSQVTEAIEKEIPTLVNIITNQLSKKKVHITDLEQPENKSTFTKPAQKNQFYRSRRNTTHNQYGNPPQNDHLHGSTFKISEANTNNSHLPIHPQSSPYNDPYSFYEESRKKQIQSAKYLRPPHFYENEYHFPTSREIYTNSPKSYVNPAKLQQINSYENSGNILVEVLAPRKKSTHSKRKQSQNKNCDCRKKELSSQKKKVDKRVNIKEYAEKRQNQKERPQKLKEKVVEEKITKVSKSLGVSEDQVAKYVEDYCYLEPIEIIQKIKENTKKKLEEKQVQTSNLRQSLHSSSGKSATSSKRLVTEATNMSKGPNILHRMQRMESQPFQNPRSELGNSIDSQKSNKLSVRSISNALPSKSIKEKGRIFLKMSEMFGQERKSQIFKFIEENEHRTEESIIRRWIKKHEFVP